jgi:ABC-type bacteriocin/lantibiotic exporter with double-glycine peptidase domain
MMLTHLIGNLLWMIDTSRDVIFDYGSIKNSEFLQVETKQLYVEGCKPLELSGSVPLLKTNHVYFKYEGQSDWALKDINITVYPKEKVLIIGEIGSGKSTLIKILLRLMRPDKGNIYLNNNCYKDFSTKSFFKQIGFMPQNCVLFNRSIFENIRYDNESITERQVMDVLHRFGIAKHFSNLKEGIHADVGKNGTKLSGGQRQLVWFLKIYLKNPELIIMDEPTSSLDKGTTELFTHIINTLLHDKTIIIVTHDDRLSSIATKTYICNDGSLTMKKQ